MLGLKFIVAALAASSTLVALDPVVSITPRAELRGNTSGDMDLRRPVIPISRVGVAATAGAWKGRAVAQSTGTWGDMPALQLYEGWLQYSDGALSARLGRQVIVQHEMRLFAHRLWRPRGVAHDALRVRFEQPRWHLDAFVGQPFDEERPFAAVVAGYRDKRSAGGAPGKLLIDALWIRDGSSWSGPWRQTAGLYALIKRGAWSGRVEGYQQSGALDDLSVSAWMASARATHRRGRLSLAAHAEMLSGDDAGARRGSGAFALLHGARHAFYGLQDVTYLRVGGTADGRGLAEIALQARWDHGPWWALLRFGDQHFADGDVLGKAVDAVGRYQFGPHSAVELGAGVLARPASTPWFAYLAYRFILKP